MKKAVLVVNSVAGAAVLTMVSAAASILYLVFTTSDTPAYREGLFGGVFFRAEDLADGGIGSTLGVGEPLPLFVVFGVLTALLLLVQVAYHVLAGYRAALIAERSGASSAAGRAADPATVSSSSR